MGTIPKSVIQDLLEKTDIVTVISAYVPLKKAGNRFKACCPFHHEKTPSFHVNPQKQFYHCFGCHASGDAIRFVMDHQRMDFVGAVELLASHIGMDVPREGSQAPAVDPQDKACMLAASVFYREQLAASEAAVAYLKSRGISGETAKRYALGFAPQHTPSVTQYLAKRMTPEQGRRIGLMNKQDRDYFFGPRIMFPLRDLRGTVVGFGGRTLTDQQPKYINSPETPLFHKSRELYGLHELLQSKQAINRLLVVEGYMDVVSLAEHGVPYAVATLGTAITRGQVQKCLRYTKQLTFAFDGDRAGRQAAWRAMEASLPLLIPGVDIRFLFLPEGEDPDSFVRKQGLPAFEAVLTEASELADFFIDHLKQHYPLDSMANRSLFAEKSAAYLQTVPEGPCRQLLQEQASQVLGSDVARYTQVAPKAEQPQAAQRVQAQSRLKQKPVWHALALLLAHPEWVRDVPEDAWWLKDTNTKAIPLFADVCRRLRAQPGLRAHTLLAHYPPETASAMQRLVCWEPILEDPAALHAEWLGLLDQLQQSYLKQVTEQMIARAKEGGLSDQEKRDLADLLLLKAGGRAV